MVSTGHSTNLPTVKTVSLLTEPHDGTRGHSFEEFKARFKSNLLAEFLKDDHYSAWDAVMGTDQGSPNGPAMPGGANLAGAQLKLRKRQTNAYKLIFQHINDPKIRELLNAINNPDACGRLGWELIVRECEESLTDLEAMTLKAKFTNASIMESVGHTESTITDYIRYLHAINTRLRLVNQQYSDADVCTRLLGSITSPASLAHDAMTELQASGERQRFRVPIDPNNPGAARGRDLNAIVKYFDGLWRGQFNSGMIRRVVMPGGGEATAFEVSEEETTEEASIANQRRLTRRPMTRFQNSNGSTMTRSNSKVDKSKSLCNRCLGKGHWARECPTDEENKATIAEMMTLLSTKATERAAELRETKPTSETADEVADVNDEPFNDDDIFGMFSALATLDQSQKVDITLSVIDDQVNGWIIDCGASSHCTPFIEDLEEICDNNPGIMIRVADGSMIKVTHIGTTTIHAKEGSFGISHVLVAPDLKHRLFSTKNAFDRDGIRTLLNDDLYLVTPDNTRVHFICKSKQLFLPTVETGMNAEDNESLLQHRRLAHFGERRLRACGIIPKHDPRDCVPCMLNLRRKSFRPKTDKSTRQPYSHFGHRVSSDLLEMPPSLVGDYKYVLLFVDAWSGYTDARYLKEKGTKHIMAGLQDYVAEHKHLLKNGTVDEWRTDNEQVFTHETIADLCHRLSIYKTNSASYTPEMNGQVERANGIFVRQTRILLADAGLVDGLWPYAFNQVMRVHNSLPTRAGNHSTFEKSAYERVHKRAPNLEVFKVWGCKCYVSLTEKQRDKKQMLKTESVRAQAVHLGYDKRAPGYYVYIPQFKQFTTVQSIEFDERSTLSVPELRNDQPPITITGNPNPNRQMNRGAVRPNTDTDTVVPAPERMRGQHPVHGQPRVTTRLARAEGEIADFAYYGGSYVGESYDVNLADVDPIPTPKSFWEAVNGTHKDQWMAAMKDDIKGKLENGPNGAWTLVNLEEMHASNRKALKGKWVYKVKYNLDKTVQEFKARWVGCGYAQIEGVDYDETFASTLRGVTVRLLMAEACRMELKLVTIDVVKAFSQSELQEVLYVEQPHGFEVDGKVCKLNMALEGTKQAAHLWQQNLSGFMIDWGFNRCSVDPCLFSKMSNGQGMHCAIYVDDLLIGYNDDAMLIKFEEDFGKRFTSKPSTACDRFLGMEITRNPSTKSLKLTQERYIEKIFDKYLCGESTVPWKLPCASSSRVELSKFMSITEATTETEKAKMLGKDYSGLLGSLLYASCMTRPDIAFHTAFLCQFMQNPSIEAHNAGLGIAAYLNSSKTVGITYGGVARECSVIDINRKDGPIVHADSSFGRDVQPFGGGFIEYEQGAVSWLARKTKFIPQSSCEAETAAIVMVVKESRFVRDVLEFLGAPTFGPTPAITDNKAAFDIVKNPGATKRTNHFDRWLHYARELYLRNALKIYLVPTENMMADAMTKATDRQVFFRCRAYTMNEHAT